MRKSNLRISEPIDPTTGQTWINSGRSTNSNTGSRRRYILAWWLGEAQNDPGISHKMIFFLHTAFTAGATANIPESLFDHLSLLRHYSLGNFKEFAKKMTLDTLMLQYLDNRSNRAVAPNENYGREFLELFTISKGPQKGPEDYTNYTEQDVRAAAKLLTGFTNSANRRGERIDSDTGLPAGIANINQHDRTDKEFSYAFQNTIIAGAQTEAEMWQELDDFVEMVFSQPATARFLATRLYRYFVKKNINTEVERDIINPLADVILAENYELKPTLETLLGSLHFYDEDDSNPNNETIGGIIKSPLEIFLQGMNVFETQVTPPNANPQNYFQTLFGDNIQNFLSECNMKIFEPPVVAGYSAYHQAPDFNRLWFNATTMVPRYSAGKMLLNGKRFNSGRALGTQVDIVDFVRNSGHFATPTEAESIVQTFIDYLLPETPDNERFTYFQDVFLGGLSPINWMFEWNGYLETGDDSDVVIPLKNLCEAIFSAPEYQLM